MYCQGFVFHIWAPHFIFQTVLNFKIIAPALHQDCWASPLVSLIQQIPTGTHAFLFIHHPTLLPKLILPLEFSFPFMASLSHQSHSPEASDPSWTLLYFSCFPLTCIPNTRALDHQILSILPSKCPVICFHFAVSTTTMKAFVISPLDYCNGHLLPSPSSTPSSKPFSK